MVNDTATWAVVATVDEPPALVQAFVAWYLSLGAAHVFVYCDRPNDPVQTMLAELPQVTFVACDDAHWLRVGKSRPRRHEVRQVRNAQDAYLRTDADWLLHCDADEFLFADTVVGSHLAAVSDDTDCLVLSVAERVHRPSDTLASIFEGAFRRPFRDAADRGREVFGPDFDLTYRGLTGHAQGKAFVRTDRPMQMSIHRPRSRGADQDIALERAQVDRLELLHFEGLTPAYWAFKLTRMIEALQERDGMPPSQHRRKQADALIAAPDQAADLYRRLKCPDAATIDVLERLRLWATPTFDPASAVVRYFPNAAFDPSPAAIDLWLQENKQRVVSYLHK
ncbi:glycosyltransferase family 2 protein [Yoonia sp. F2084L]|uniref:glycosyltransferase family 2 protein n=1 Tax=Yoonia sp. F2084L TaxID=2926419 RepID=UPI001FF54CE3|nr:glycosyltransferase family 2 protein [Yoonia sp. F2084L]